MSDSQKAKKSWGGRRPGAGRKRTRPLSDSPHVAREAHDASHPVHVVFRKAHGLPSLRGPIFDVIKTAIALCSTEDFAVLHFSTSADHVHLIVEAPDGERLTSGIQGCSVRIARAINVALGRRGQLWDVRYFSRELGTPRLVRDAIAYVLLHSGTGVDPCSSAPWFDGFSDETPLLDDSPVVPATTTLGKTWRRAGLLSSRERPAYSPPGASPLSTKG